MTTAAPLATLPGLRAALVEQVIEVQALANRVLNASPEHRKHAQAIRSQLHELARVLRHMHPLPEETDALETFFPTPGRPGAPRKVAFVHLEDD